LGRTRQELLETMAPDEWPYWLAMAELDPFDDDRRDSLLAQLCSMVQGALLGKDDKHLHNSPADFMPWYGTRKATIEEIINGNIPVTSKRGKQVLRLWRKQEKRRNVKHRRSWD
jgi:hypothetical protein